MPLEIYSKWRNYLGACQHVCCCAHSTGESRKRTGYVSDMLGQKCGNVPYASDTERVKLLYIESRKLY